MPYIYNSQKQPKESKYWHFRINDTSEEQYNQLVNLDCDWIRIGMIEENKVRQGSHYHCAIKFNRSYGITHVKEACLYNKALHSDDWYLGTKYTKSKAQGFMMYTIKQGIRFDNKHEDDDGKDVPDEELNSHELTKEERQKLLDKKRLYYARMLDYDWFINNDLKFFLSNNAKSLFANCQHNLKLKNLEKKDNVFLVDEPGEGKSSLIDFLFPGCYRKLKTNEKWDSYSNYLPAHETVYFDEMDSIDEFDSCLGSFSEFKTITDVYPFPTRTNYGNTQINIRPKRFIITSNYTISKLMSTPNKYGKLPSNVETLTKAFRRRFLCVDNIGVIHKAIGCYFDKEKKRTFWISDWYKNRWENRGDFGICDFIIGFYPVISELDYYFNTSEEYDTIYIDEIEKKEDDIESDLLKDMLKQNVLTPKDPRFFK